MTREEPTTADGREQPSGAEPFEARYERRRLLGRGGMGEVWLHFDRMLGRDVAVKHLNAEMSRHPEVRARRRAEGQTCARLRSPYIAQVFDQRDRGDEVRIVFEFVDGESLGERRRRVGRLAWSETAPIATAVARGLEAAHREGIVHRDLKPGNVMLPRDPGRAGAVAKLVDWGIAVGGPDLEGGTTAKDPFQFAGTPEYMAPERLNGDSGPAADVWSFGCVLFECLAGARAFPQDREKKDLLQRIVAGQADFSALPSTTPAAVRDAIRACLTPDPRSRPDSMRVVLDAIDPEGKPVRRSRARLPPIAPSDAPRREVVDAVVAGIRGGWCISISGPIGVGKSWVARAALDRLRDEAEFAIVDLGGVVDAAQAARLIDAELDAGDEATRPILLLDGADGVQDEIPRLVASVSRGVAAVVVTSRRPVAGAAANPGWRCRPIDPLAVPSPTSDHSPNALREIDAVRYFCCAARERHPSFSIDRDNAEAVAQVCRRLGGLAAALSLAAAQCHYLAPSDLLDRLEEVLRPLIGSDGDAESPGSSRRMIDGTVAWSVRQSKPEERLLLDRLAIFAGGWTLPTAVSVCCFGDLDVDALHRALNGLVDAGLVRFEPAVGRSRYRLFAPVRSYLLSCGAIATDAEFRAALATRHLARCVALAKESYAGWQLKLPPPVAYSQATWLARIDHEFSDCLDAIEFARTRRDGLEEAVDLAIAVHAYWYARGLRREGTVVLDRLLEAWGARGDVREVRLLSARARLLFSSDRPKAAAGYRRAAEIERSIVDRAGGGEVDVERQRLAAILHNLALLGLQTEAGERLEARGFLAEAIALYDACGNRDGRTATRLTEAQFLLEDGRLDEADRELEAALESYRDAGDSARIDFAIHTRARVALWRGDRAKARALCGEALSLRRQASDVDGIAESLRLAGEIDVADGRIESAVYLFAASARRHERIGSSMPLNELQRYEALFRESRRTLGSARFGEVWSEGADATDEEAARRVTPPDATGE